MALRLTLSTLDTDGLATPGGSSAPSAESLAAQARSLLSAGDFAGYAGLFERAGEHENPQRVYQAHVALVESGLGAAGRTADMPAIRIFAAVADAALSALEATPAEPVLLNYAGVACYELWGLDAAHALFTAARRLDPELPNVTRNLNEVGRRRREAGRRSRPIHASVPGLTRRARTVAGQATPASGLTLSLCMIVRDEEQMLPRCLAAVAAAVDEIVIVDTGSTDATIEIARSFGARVIEHAWTGSFAEPRNISFDAATGDWLLYLDADEVLCTEDAALMRRATGHTWREGMYVVETSYVGELGEGGAVINNALRLFRNRPEYRFEGRLHEQIMQTLPTFAPGRIGHTPIRIQHYGYLGSVREAKEKSRRNVELLRAQARDGEATPFHHFNLASEYAACGEIELAIDEFKRAWTLLSEQGTLRSCEYAAPLSVRLVNTLRLCGRLTEAEAAAREGLELFPDLTDLVLGQARIALARGDDDDALALYDRCMEMGDAPARYGPILGAGTFLPRLALAERHLQRGEAAPARELLKWCVEHHPDFLAVAGPYAVALLRDGATPDEVSAALDGLGALPPRVRLAVATALQAAGAAPQAEHQLQLALAAAPADARVRVTLGEALLARGAWDEAARVAAPVDGDDPRSGLARRIELNGVIGRAAPDAVQAALARAAGAGLPSGEMRAYTAWSAIAQGAPAPDGLPLSCAPALAVILLTLLRGGDTDRFEALLPALTASRLPPREQRELLGEMYLERGLLQRAAAEWMAACSPTPDARGLFGLARVAVAGGMPEDAGTFVTGALELDPAHAGAAQLRDALAAAVTRAAA